MCTIIAHGSLKGEQGCSQDRRAVMLNALLSSAGLSCGAYGWGVMCMRLLNALAVCHRHAQSKLRCLPTCIGTADWARVVFYEALFKPLLHPGQPLLGICLVLLAPLLHLRQCCCLLHSFSLQAPLLPNLCLPSLDIALAHSADTQPPNLALHSNTVGLSSALANPQSDATCTRILDTWHIEAPVMIFQSC